MAPEVEESDAAALREVVDEIATMTGRVPALSAREATAGKLAVTKVRKLSTKCHWNAAVSDDLKAACVEHAISPPKKLIRDISVRWNSTSNTVYRAVELRKPVETVAAKSVFNKPRGIQLKKLVPDEAEWTLLTSLIPLLDVSVFAMSCQSSLTDYFSQSILYVTTEVSRSNTPMVHQIIPLIDFLTTVFEDVIDDDDQTLIIRHAALRGMVMLNKYYERTDDSVACRFAMSKSSR